jgi:hypothetical protein
VRITNFGRPVGEFPLFRLRDGEGGWFLALSRVDVSDVGKVLKAEPMYKPFFKKDARDGMETWHFHFFDTELILFFTKRGVQHHVERHQTPEE